MHAATHTLGIWLVALCALGCATGLELRAGRNPPTGESLVFGAVEVKGELIGKVAIVAGGDEEVTVWDLGAGEEMEVVPIASNAETPFYWHLPPGKYSIMHYRENRTVTLVLVSSHSSEELRIAAEFTVPETPGVFYVGTLLITIYDEDRVTKKVEDRYAEAEGAFRARHPDAGEVTKQLLVFEEG